MSTNTAGGSLMVARPRIQKRRGIAQAGRHRRGPLGRIGLGAGEQRVESLKEMSEPEARVADIGLLVLQTKDGSADLAQQGGAIDLGRQSSGSSSSTAPATERSAEMCSLMVWGSKRPSLASSATRPTMLPAAGSK